MAALLKRLRSDLSGTFGQLFLDNTFLCVTAELPWKNNDPDISCIPTGTYTCIPHNSPSHPNTWEVTNVPGRSAILLHEGNFPSPDSKGCILVGDQFGTIDGKQAVLRSRLTLIALRGELPSTFILTIAGP